MGDAVNGVKSRLSMSLASRRLVQHMAQVRPLVQCPATK